MRTSGTFIIVAAVFALAAGFFTYSIGHRLIESRCGVLSSSAGAAFVNVEDYIATHKHSLGILASDITFVKLLGSGRSEESYAQALADANRELGRRAQIIDDILRVSLLDRDGGVVASSDKGLVGTETESGAGDSGLTAGPVFTILVPVKNGGETLGSIRGEVAAAGFY